VLKANIQQVRERIERACARSGRSSADVTLIAVSKNQPLAKLLEAVEAGIADLGENRVQEAQQKFPHLPPGVRRHMIGHLQRNKARFVGELFDWVHSVDSLALAQTLGRRLRALGKQVDCLVQVNVSGEASKYGVVPEAAPELVAQVGQIEGIRVRGLMTIAPLGADERELRRVFGGLRELAERIAALRLPGVEMRHLSMGMSGDFEIAIEEGATMVRVGSALFGPRS